MIVPRTCKKRKSLLLKGALTRQPGWWHASSLGSRRRGWVPPWCAVVPDWSGAGFFVGRAWCVWVKRGWGWPDFVRTGNFIDGKSGTGLKMWRMCKLGKLASYILMWMKCVVNMFLPLVALARHSSGPVPRRYAHAKAHPNLWYV